MTGDVLATLGCALATVVLYVMHGVYARTAARTRSMMAVLRFDGRQEDVSEDRFAVRTRYRRNARSFAPGDTVPARTLRVLDAAVRVTEGELRADSLMVVFYGDGELALMGSELVVVCIGEWLGRVDRVFLCAKRFDNELVADLTARFSGDVVFCRKFARLETAFRVDVTPCVFQMDRDGRVSRVGTFSIPRN